MWLKVADCLVPLIQLKTNFQSSEVCIIEPKTRTEAKDMEHKCSKKALNM